MVSLRLKTDKILKTPNRSAVDGSPCKTSPLWLSKDITLGDWTSGFHCCIFLILGKNCFHSQLNFMSLMGHLPTIAFCYLVWMHYTESGLAFCISEWTDLSGYKQFYLYCARLHRVSIRMNFSSKRKAPNLCFRDLGAASAVVLDTGVLWMFADVAFLGNSGATWGTLLVSAVAPCGDCFPQRPPRCNRLFCLLFAHWFHLLPVFRINFSTPIDIW